MDPTAQAFADEFLPLHERLRNVLSGLASAVLDRDLGPDTNSIAVLVAHTCGSQLDWLSLAAGRPNPRDRDAEFRTRGQTADDLRALVDRVAGATPELIEAAVGAGLGTKRTPARGPERTVAYCVFHALKHTAEHVGQLELTRQLLERR